MVGGAVLMSPGLGQKAAGWRKSLLPLIGAIVLLTGVDLTSKSALSAVSPWSLFWVNLLILSIVFLAVSLRRPTLDQLRHLPQKKLTAALLLGDFALSMTGFLFFLQAMENGPVSIVSTISGSRPIFVLIFSLLVARFWPGFLQRRTGRGGLRLRIVATVMIVGGIAAMYLLR